MRCVTDLMREIALQRRIVAHRGLHDDLPENSAEAFSAAWAADLWCCECDVQRSADGAVVVIHDETLDRTTTGMGRVDEHPWSVLRELNLRDRHGQPTTYRIPLLGDVLEDMPAREHTLLVEIKPLDALDLVRQAVRLFHGQRGRHVISFDERNVEHARAEEPVGLHALLVDQPTPALLDRGTLFNHRRLSDEQLRVLSKRSQHFGLWTVNDDADVRRVLSFQPAWIISDRPLRVREIQDSVTDDRPSNRDTTRSIE